MEFDIKSIRKAMGYDLQNFANTFCIELDRLKKIEKGFYLPDEKEINKISAHTHISTEHIVNAHLHLQNHQFIGEGYRSKRKKDSFFIPREKEIDENKLIVWDLFCGIGGFSHGFEQTNAFQVSTAVDLLADRIYTFAQNHSFANAYCEDITTVKIEDLLVANPLPDVLIGGTPCQGFSSIRPYRSLNINDARNSLFDYFIHFAQKLQPQYIVLENVVGLLSHNQGKTFQIMLDTFEQLDYKVNFRVIDAALYGLPQSRTRLFIIAHKKPYCFEWKATTHTYSPENQTKEKVISVIDAIHDLPALNQHFFSHDYLDVVLTPYENMMRGGEDWLTLHEKTAHTDDVQAIINRSGLNKNKGNHLVKKGFSSSYSRLSPDLPANTLTGNFIYASSSKSIHPYQDRALTLREGARLQSFSDNYKFYGSRTTIAKQIGNAVPPLIGKMIAECILNHF